MAGAPRSVNPDKVAAVADKVAEELEAYAYGPECFTSDQSAVLAAVKGWRAFAAGLRDEGPCAAS